MKYIFLDVDGVLNCSDSFKRPCDIDPIDEDKVLRLKKIIDVTDAKVVVTSTWRLYDETKFKLGKFLYNHGIRIYECTPRICRGTRSDEIWSFINSQCMFSHDGEYGYVILDDDVIEDKELRQHQVRTHYHNNDGTPGGLQDKHVEQAIKILNS